jgi:outer membrane assembly lipoprotein YfiO
MPSLPRCSISWSVLCLGLVLHLTSTAWAQERFRLDEQGWQKQEEPTPQTPAAGLHDIRKLIAQEHADRAIHNAKRWIKKNPNDPLLVEGYLLRGDAYVADSNLYEALFDYEYVIRLYPASEQFFTALEREVDIADLYAQGKKRRVLGIFRFTAYGEAEELYIRTQERAPGSTVGERASLTLADFYFRRGNMTSAAEAYDLFLINYPQSTRREWAMLRLIQSNLATFKGPQFNPTGLIDAGARIRMFRKEYPAAAERLGADALLVRIDESLALKAYYVGKWYERRGDEVAAAFSYRQLLRDYPQTAAAEAAMARLEQLAVPTLQLPQAPKPESQDGTPLTLPAGGADGLPPLTPITVEGANPDAAAQPAGKPAAAGAEDQP